MNPDSSPFRPGRFPLKEALVGRERAIERIRGLARASAAGQVVAGFVTGERGMGKTTVARIAHRAIENLDEAAGCHTPLGGAADLDRTAARIWKHLVEQNASRPWFRPIADVFGERVQSAGPFGVRLALPPADLAALGDRFVIGVRRIVGNLHPQRKSLVLILDDLDGVAESPEFAHWLKSSLEELAVAYDDSRLCLLLVGAEERRRRLIREQPSLARVFDLIELAPWSPAETQEFFRKSFAAGNAQVEDRSLKPLVDFSGGLPALAHEIGDAVWRSAAGPTITARELSRGIALAADAVGSKLVEPRVFRTIRSDRYRSVLRKITAEPRFEFRRADLTRRLTTHERPALDDFLRRMRKLGALAPDPEIPGRYRFPNLLYARYFALESYRAASRTRPPKSRPHRAADQAISRSN